MTAETRSEIKSVIESAVANQSKLLEERLRETLSRIEAEQREAISTERSNKKRRNSETGDYGLKMQDALDSLKATTTQIIETKSEEVARALGETQKATAALEISVKELRSSNKELVRSENLSREATNGLHTNVVKLNQTMNQISISQMQDFIRKTGIEAARRLQGGSSS
jgi:dihydroneopterin aldolase